MDPDYDRGAGGAPPTLQEVLPKIATIGEFRLSLTPRTRVKDWFGKTALLGIEKQFIRSLACRRIPANLDRSC